jgi:ComF family protein
MVLARAFHAAMDLIFPGRCAGCDGDCEGRAPLCQGCRAQFDALAGHAACRFCASPLAYVDAPCPYCRGKGLPLFERIACIGTFDEPMRRVVHSIKYHGAWPLAEYLADELIKQGSAKAILKRTDLLVPVPLHPLRSLSRGYNQAQIIARRLGKKFRIKMREPLVRLRHTETQTQFHSRARRMENVKDAFGLARARCVRGKHVVLVDDVMTTGATLLSAARELRKGSPASISALVLAVADPKGHQFSAV